jgi:hypothetical protein
VSIRGSVRPHERRSPIAPAAITVTLDPPGQPRVTRALTCLLAEISQNPPVIPGDHRPITYQLAGT